MSIIITITNLQMIMMNYLLSVTDYITFGLNVSIRRFLINKNITQT